MMYSFRERLLHNDRQCLSFSGNVYLTKLRFFLPAHFMTLFVLKLVGGGPRVVVSTAAFHARVRGLVPGRGGLKETTNVSSPSACKSQYCGEPL